MLSLRPISYALARQRYDNYPNCKLLYATTLISTHFLDLCNSSSFAFSLSSEKPRLLHPTSSTTSASMEVAVVPRLRRYCKCPPRTLAASKEDEERRSTAYRQIHSSSPNESLPEEGGLRGKNEPLRHFYAYYDIAPKTGFLPSHGLHFYPLREARDQ